MNKKTKINSLSKFSYHGSTETLQKVLEVYRWDFVQIQLNYYDWHFGDAKELYETLEQANIPIIVMEPVNGGLLANLTDEVACRIAKRSTRYTNSACADSCYYCCSQSHQTCSV